MQLKIDQETNHNQNQPHILELNYSKNWHISHNIKKPTIIIQIFENTHVNYVSRQNFHRLLRVQRSRVVRDLRSTNDCRTESVLFCRTFSLYVRKRSWRRRRRWPSSPTELALFSSWQVAQSIRAPRRQATTSPPLNSTQRHTRLFDVNTHDDETLVNVDRPTDVGHISTFYVWRKITKGHE